MENKQSAYLQFLPKYPTIQMHDISWSYTVGPEWNKCTGSFDNYTVDIPYRNPQYNVKDFLVDGEDFLEIEND